MPVPAMEAYLRHLPAYQAQVRLLIADAVSVPHLGRAERRRVLDIWQTMAYGDSRPRLKPSPLVLASMGIGVRTVGRVTG